MYGISPFILIILPVIFQIIYGRKAIGETISLKFSTIIFISILSHLILSILSLLIASYNFNQNLKGSHYSCGMGFMGIIALSFLLFIILIFVIITQYFIKRSYEK